MYRRTSPRDPVDKRQDTSKETSLIDEMVFLKDGARKMCPREHRNLKNMMIKKKYAGKPKYLTDVPTPVSPK